MVNPGEHARQGHIESLSIDSLFGSSMPRMELVLEHETRKSENHTWHIDISLDELLELRAKIDNALTGELRRLEAMCRDCRGDIVAKAYESDDRKLMN